ncbi:MAG: hypothetical protein HY078_10580 [Elusimicrobia bacterium]|nr:hypothetical protein [Elusimicrobiota bacterium]
MININMKSVVAVTSAMSILCYNLGEAQLFRALAPVPGTLTRGPRALVEPRRQLRPELPPADPVTDAAPNRVDPPDRFPPPRPRQAAGVDSISMVVAPPEVKGVAPSDFTPASIGETRNARECWQRAGSFESTWDAVCGTRNPRTWELVARDYQVSCRKDAQGRREIAYASGVTLTLQSSGRRDAYREQVLMRRGGGRRVLLEYDSSREAGERWRATDLRSDDRIAYGAHADPFRAADSGLYKLIVAFPDGLTSNLQISWWENLKNLKAYTRGPGRSFSEYSDGGDWRLLIRHRDGVLTSFEPAPPQGPTRSTAREEASRELLLEYPDGTVAYYSHDEKRRPFDRDRFFAVDRDGTTERSLMSDPTRPEGQRWTMYAERPNGTKETRIVSPLVFDLAGSGTLVADARVRFDLIGDGSAQSFHDAARDAGVLVFDADGDGKAGSDGRELFGDRTDIDGRGEADGYADGFAALEALVRKAERQGAVPTGTLHRGILRSGDLAALGRAYGFGMRVGGVLGRTLTLEAAGVREIHLARGEAEREFDFDGRGDDIVRRAGAVFVRADGSRGGYADVFFRADVLDPADGLVLRK